VWSLGKHSFNLILAFKIMTHYLGKDITLLFVKKKKRGGATPRIQIGRDL
jgi:hypothetical protein